MYRQVMQLVGSWTESARRIQDQRNYQRCLMIIRNLLTRIVRMYREWSGNKDSASPINSVAVVLRREEEIPVQQPAVGDLGLKKIAQIKANVKAIKNTCQGIVGMLVTRELWLQQMEEQSTLLLTSSTNFRVQAKALHKKMWWTMFYTYMVIYLAWFGAFVGGCLVLPRWAKVLVALGVTYAYRKMLKSFLIIMMALVVVWLMTFKK